MYEQTIVENKLNMKFDLLEISEETGYVKINVIIDFNYIDSEIHYDDNLWFNKKSIADFVDNLNNDSGVLKDTDGDLNISLKDNVMYINICKRNYCTKDNLKLIFETNISQDLFKLKDFFNSIHI